MPNKVYVLLISFFLASCAGEKKSNKELTKANGDAYYGGVFKMNEGENFRSLFPLNITETISHRITNQIYEGLVKLNPVDLTVIPGLAESWKRNDDATQWIFTIRKGVKFHDNQCFPDGEGRELTANDFKYCFEKLCTASPENQLFEGTFKDKVAGANEYFESTEKKMPLKEGVAGIKVINDYTIQIGLLHPFAGFLNLLSTPGCWVYPHEAFEKYGIEMRKNCVGTGPFQVKSIVEGEAVVLERNPDYWAIDDDRNHLPFLNGIKITFIKDKNSEIMEFKKRNLDLIYQLPLETVHEVLGTIEGAKDKNLPFELQVVSAMSVFYYGFQHQSPMFNRKEVRLAFNYAIDRQKIVDYVLGGEGIPANYGIVPPAIKEYDTHKIQGYSFDVEKAKKLMAEAGYPDGKGFPRITVQINKGSGDRNVQVAEVIQKMLKDNLNVDIDINLIPLAQQLESVETGKADFWRTSWTADYPDPETFLSLFSGKSVPIDPNAKSYLNSGRYISQKFDSIYYLAMREVDDKKRMELYQQADQVQINDGAVMPIFYSENYRLIQSNVKNFPANAMEYRDLTRVYFVPQKETDENTKKQKDE